MRNTEIYLLILVFLFKNLENLLNVKGLTILQMIFKKNKS